MTGSVQCPPVSSEQILTFDLFSLLGFYELSDGASGSLSNSSHSVFSECFCSTADAEGYFLSTGTLTQFEQEVITQSAKCFLSALTSYLSVVRATLPTLTTHTNRMRRVVCEILMKFSEAWDRISNFEPSSLPADQWMLTSFSLSDSTWKTSFR